MFSRQVTLVFSFSLAKNSVNLSKNYYKILQVDTKCDQKVLKNSYLKLVKTLHPDVNPNGKEKFTQVQEAYEVLSDKELKSYYDQNNHCTGSSAQYTSSKKETHSAQSKSRETSSGHTYYQHRSYASQNPHDYFYNHNHHSNAQAQSKKQRKNDYEDDQQESYQKKSTNFNRQQKYARSQASWQEFQRRKQFQEQQQFRHQTPQQKKMRDKLKAMRGFTSSYNVLWGRHHLRHDHITNSHYDIDRKRQEQIRQLMPDKVRKFYDKLMDKISKIAEN